jgi:hypothetical protein
MTESRSSICFGYEKSHDLPEFNSPAALAQYKSTRPPLRLRSNFHLEPDWAVIATHYLRLDPSPLQRRP